MTAVNWRCQWHTQRQVHRLREIQSASKTQCMLYFWRAGGARGGCQDGGRGHGGHGGHGHGGHGQTYCNFCKFYTGASGWLDVIPLRAGCCLSVRHKPIHFVTKFTWSQAFTSPVFNFHTKVFNGVLSTLFKSFLFFRVQTFPNQFIFLISICNYESMTLIFPSNS